MLENNLFVGMDYEVKNRKTGKIYWMSKKGVDELRRQGTITRFTVQELKSMKMVTSPLSDFKIEKKNEGKRKEDVK